MLNINLFIYICSTLQDFPIEFGMYLNYCRELKFAEIPNYLHLKQIFRGLFRKIASDHDHTFDWTLLEKKNCKCK